MDETGNNLPKTLTGFAAVIILIGAGIALGRCSAPAAAQSQETQAPLTLDAATSIAYDFHDTAGRALAELGMFLHSATTTTLPQTTTNPDARPSEPVILPDDRWDQLAQCETGGNWTANTGNGYGGGLQFAHTSSWSTWLSYGGGDYAPHPWEASREQQIAVAENVLAGSGYKAWPGCSRKFGWI